MKGMASWSVAAATVVGGAALWGGAFLPLPAAVMGAGLALVLASGLVTESLPRLAREEVLAGALVAWGVVAAVVAAGSPLASKQTLGGWLAAWLLWILGRRAAPAARTAGSKVLAGCTAVLAVAVLLQWWVYATPRVGGLLENPNVAAALLVTGVLVSLPALGRGWLAAAFVVLAGAALIGTGSRAGLVAAAVAVVVLLPRGRPRRLGAAAASVGVLLLLWWRTVGRGDPFAWHRLALWRALLELVRSHPVVGVGPGGLAEAAGVVRLAEPSPVAVHQWLISYAESSPLAVLVAVGVPGLLLAVAAVVAWLVRLRREGASPWLWAAAAAMGTFAAFHDQLEVGVVLWWWALVAGLLDRPTRQQAPRTAGRALVGLTAAVALAACLVQPAVARLWWQGAPVDPASVRSVLRFEPFFATAPAALAERALGRPDWSWRLAVEAAYWSGRAVSAHPGSAALHALEARVYTRIVTDLGVWPDAVKRAREAWAAAAAREPHLPWYWYRWALLERSLGEVERARGLAERAVAAEPHFVRGWLLLARLELDLGRMRAARSALARAEASRDLARGRLLTGYERELLEAPRWQLRQLEEALP